MSRSSIESSLQRWVRLALGALAALALWGVLLALSPAVAQGKQATVPVVRGAAQSTAQGTAQGTASAERTVVVVKPGDSLWSMSEERLGPSATPQRVARLVERTYSLNGERIGADPTLIFPGQRLLVPPVSSEPSTDSSKETVSQSSTAKASSSSTVGQEAPDAPEAPVAASEAPAATPAHARGPALPEAAPAVPVPAVRETAAQGSSPSPFASVFEAAARSVLSTGASLPSTLASTLDRYEVARQIVGVGLIAASLPIPVAVALAAVRRARVARRYKERWHREYFQAHNTPQVPSQQMPREVPDRPRLARNGRIETLVAACKRRQRKRQRTQGAQGRVQGRAQGSSRRAASSRQGTRRRGAGAAFSGAWNPEIRRHLTRRATPTQRTRPRGDRSLSRGISRPARTRK